MGWFSSGNNASPPTPKASNDGGYIAPDRSARTLCWEGRDAFFECLEKNGIIDSVKEDEKAKQLCAPELKEFEKQCAASWVTYFKKRRVFEHQKEQTLKRIEAEGAKELQTSPVMGANAAALRGR